MGASTLARLQILNIDHQYLGRRSRLRRSLLCLGGWESGDSSDTKTQSCTKSDCLAKHVILPSSVKEAAVELRGLSANGGRDPYSENRLAASGRGASPSKITDSAGRTLFKPTVHSKNGCAERTLPVNAICGLLYIPRRHAVQWNTPSEIKLRRYAQETAARLCVQ